jgi:hypothetical protein
MLLVRISWLLPTPLIRLLRFVNLCPWHRPRPAWSANLNCSGSEMSIQPKEELSNSLHHTINRLRKHFHLQPKQASHTGKPLLGRDWKRHAEITDPDHHYRHMKMHADLAERNAAEGNFDKARQHALWAKGHHALARNKLTHMGWRPDVEHNSSVEIAEYLKHFGRGWSAHHEGQSAEHHKAHAEAHDMMATEALKAGMKSNAMKHFSWRNRHNNAANRAHTNVEQADTHNEGVKHVRNEGTHHSLTYVHHPEHKAHRGYIPREGHAKLHERLTKEGWSHKAKPFGYRDPTEHRYSKDGTHIDIERPHYTDESGKANTHYRVSVHTPQHAAVEETASEGHHDEAVHLVKKHARQVRDIPAGHDSKHKGLINDLKRKSLHNTLVKNGYEHKQSEHGHDSYSKGPTNVRVRPASGFDHHVTVHTFNKPEHSNVEFSALRPGRSWVHHSKVKHPHHHLRQISWHANRMKHHLGQWSHKQGSEEGKHHLAKAKHHERWISKHHQALRALHG